MNLGMGAMIHYLSGGSKHSADEYYGQTVLDAALVENRLRLKLDSGKTIEIWDDGQSCCESRFMTTDDDPAYIRGGKLIKIETKNGPDEGDEAGEYGECHETCFIEIGTDKGFITLTNHNKHNGYYGGFGLTITERGESGR